jgi:hypothetical protein
MSDQIGQWHEPAPGTLGHDYTVKTWEHPNTDPFVVGEFQRLELAIEAAETVMLRDEVWQATVFPVGYVLRKDRVGPLSDPRGQTDWPGLVAAERRLLGIDPYEAGP